MAQLNFTCGACGQTLRAPTEDELVRDVHDHAQAHHPELNLTEEKIRAMLREKK